MNEEKDWGLYPQTEVRQIESVKFLTDRFSVYRRVPDDDDPFAIGTDLELQIRLDGTPEDPHVYVSTKRGEYIRDLKSATFTYKEFFDIMDNIINEKRKSKEK